MFGILSALWLRCTKLKGILRRAAAMDNNGSTAYAAAQDTYYLATARSVYDRKRANFAKVCALAPAAFGCASCLTLRVKGFVCSGTICGSRYPTLPVRSAPWTRGIFTEVACSIATNSIQYELLKPSVSKLFGVCFREVSFRTRGCEAQQYSEVDLVPELLGLVPGMQQHSQRPTSTKPRQKRLGSGSRGSQTGVTGCLSSWLSNRLQGTKC